MTFPSLEDLDETDPVRIIESWRRIREDQMRQNEIWMRNFEEERAREHENERLSHDKFMRETRQLIAAAHARSIALEEERQARIATLEARLALMISLAQQHGIEIPQFSDDDL